MSTKASEQMLMTGVCPDCGGELGRVWTSEAIKEAKDDIGMTDEDDFHDCCRECAKNYMPADLWHELYGQGIN